MMHGQKNIKSFNVILPVKPGLPGDVLPSSFSTKAVYALLLPPYVPYVPLSHSWFDHSIKSISLN
jgi:hypothetical protein